MADRSQEEAVARNTFLPQRIAVESWHTIVTIESFRVEHTTQTLAANCIAVFGLCQIDVSGAVARTTFPPAYVRGAKIIVGASVAPRTGISYTTVA